MSNKHSPFDPLEAESWNPMSPQFTLSDQDVHFWHVHLEDFAPELPRMLKTLNSDELDRGHRYKFEHSRTQFFTCRGLLREMLESYGVASAAEIEFSFGEFGKPELAPAHESNRIEFNLSHSDKYAVMAFTYSMPIGVDLEMPRVIKFDSLAETVFSPEELQEYYSTPLDTRFEAFYRGWTRKESFIKALGTGVSLPLQTFAVSLSREQPRFLRIDGNERDSAWMIVDESREPNYFAALVMQGESRRVTSRRLLPFKSA